MIGLSDLEFVDVLTRRNPAECLEAASKFVVGYEVFEIFSLLILVVVVAVLHDGVRNSLVSPLLCELDAVSRTNAFSQREGSPSNSRPSILCYIGLMLKKESKSLPYR